jgi:DNA primase
MAKISPIASKYIVQAKINIEGIVDRPDVVGAIFGQTEGLLGNDLELRELQRSGKIGRIEVTLKTSGGKTTGQIVIPSSLDKTETAIVGAALEIIQRIGPCNSTVLIEKIEDVRVSKRQFVIERAKALLKDLTQNTLPDSQEIADEVSKSVRMMEIQTFGRERLPCGPAINEAEEIIIVEGRADVLTLLKNGFKNVISMEGSSVPVSLIELTKKKGSIVFVDGDRGGILNIRELVSVADIDYVCRAPDGKEVEELTKKEIHKALRGRITSEQAKLDLGITKDGELINKDKTIAKHVISQSERSPAKRPTSNGYSRPTRTSAQNTSRRPQARTPTQNRSVTPNRTVPRSASNPTEAEKKKFKETVEKLFGTRGACIFDTKLNVLGKVPLSELKSTVKSLKTGMYALALDGNVDDKELVSLAERVGIKYIAGSKTTLKSSRVAILTDANL